MDKYRIFLPNLALVVSSVYCGCLYTQFSGDNMIIEHLVTQHVNTELYKQSLQIDTQTNQATFMLCDGSHNFTGYLMYNPTGVIRSSICSICARSLAYIREGKAGFWGMEYQSVAYPTVMVIVESVFAAARLHNAGIQAIAVPHKNSTEVIKKLLTFKRNYTTIFLELPHLLSNRIKQYADFVLQIPEPITEMSKADFQTYVIDKILGVQK